MPFGAPRYVYLDPGLVCCGLHLQCIRKRKSNGLFQKHVQATLSTSEKLRRVMNIRRRDESNVSLDALQCLTEFCKHGSRNRKLESLDIRCRRLDDPSQFRIRFEEEQSQPVATCGAAADEECSRSQSRS